MRTQEDILAMIEDEDIQFIRLQFTDINGNLKNIAVTPGQLDRVIANHYSFSGNTLFDNAYDYPDELYLHPDLDSFVVLPWRPQQGKVAKLVCDVYTEDGKPFYLSPRRILKTVLDRAKAQGYTFLVDPECEFFLFHTDENGLPTTITHERAGYMDVGPSDFGENARREIVLMLEDMGFDIESSHHEDAPAQHEVDFKEQSALQMADSIQTFRFAVRSVAKRFGLYATFMPKPRSDCAGSGMHIGIILMKDGRNLFRSPDGSISDQAYWFTGGILQHAPALVAVANPTVNSYRRLHSGYGAPDRVNWSRRGERSFAKINHKREDTRVELRFPDGSSNPYLLLAACIAAGIDGMERQLDPGSDCWGAEPTAYPAVPATLKDAISALSQDAVICSALGQEFTEIFTEVKQKEWDSYMLCVSDWELDRYLTRI